MRKAHASAASACSPSISGVQSRWHCIRKDISRAVFSRQARRLAHIRPMATLADADGKHNLVDHYERALALRAPRRSTTSAKCWTP